MVQEGIMEFALRKTLFLQTFVKRDGFELNHLFPAQVFTRHNGKFNICMERRIQIICRMIFVISSHLVLALERTNRRKHFMVKSIDFDRLMTSEGTETLILAFTSKTGNP